MLSEQVTLACVNDGLNRCITSFLPFICSLTIFFHLFNTNFDT